MKFKNKTPEELRALADKTRRDMILHNAQGQKILDEAEAMGIPEGDPVFRSVKRSMRADGQLILLMDELTVRESAVGDVGLFFRMMKALDDAQKQRAIMVRLVEEFLKR